jgi:hypothetical protein
MKYTNYLINGDFINGKALEAMPKILLPLSLSVAIAGVVVIAGVLPIAFMADTARNVQCTAIKFERKYHYAHNVVGSKVFKFAVIKPINIVVVNPIHNVLKIVA